MQAYDIELLGRATPLPGEERQGWCFGLPPGMAPEQWPLDPHTGYPLMHGFTIRLPEDYRVHGPDITALSFFALAPDQNDGGPVAVDGIEGQIIDPPAQPPDDPHLLPFWTAGRASHPRLHRMEDILGGAYAVILLTDEAFHGAPCRPPQLPPDNPFLAQTTVPDWLTSGYTPPDLLRWSPRQSDPNAGVPPDEYGDGGYQPHFYWENGIIAAANHRVHAWSKDHKPNHIGGTMRPIQAMPKFSPFYIEFEEHFGGYNFGGGNAQLDFRDMKFDWACG